MAFLVEDTSIGKMEPEIEKISRGRAKLTTHEPGNTQSHMARHSTAELYSKESNIGGSGTMADQQKQSSTQDKEG